MLSRLQLARTDATGADIIYDVHIRAAEEAQIGSYLMGPSSCNPHLPKALSSPLCRLRVTHTRFTRTSMVIGSPPTVAHLMGSLAWAYVICPVPDFENYVGSD